MAKGVLIKSPHGYLPHNESAVRLDARTDYGDMWEYTFVKIRCPRSHKRFFAMISDAYKAFNTKRTRDDFRKDLIFEAGFYDVKINHAGKPYAVVKSLNYASMDQEEFQAVHSRILDVIIQTLDFDHDTQLYFICNFGVPNK